MNIAKMGIELTLDDGLNPIPGYIKEVHASYTPPEVFVSQSVQAIDDVKWWQFWLPKKVYVYTIIRSEESPEQEMGQADVICDLLKQAAERK